RKLPIAVQVKHLLMTNLVDDFIIGNAFASESELQSLSEINLAMPSFDVYLNNDITGIDETIVTEEFHFNRGDISDYVIRSTMSRVHIRMSHSRQITQNKLKKVIL